MIYVDSSVVLAYVLGQDRRPPPEFWQQSTIASRLVEYEVWNRVHVYRLPPDDHVVARSIIDRVAFREMSQETLRRALQPFPLPIRTLDSLHLATMDHLLAQGMPTTLASYDLRLLAVAAAMGFQTLQP